MTGVIGDEDSGWASATVQNGKLVQDVTVQRPKPQEVEFQINGGYMIAPVMPTAKDLEEEISTTTTSPKARDSSHKIPVNLCPASAIIAIALVIAQGHKKPGRTIYNWRDKNQKISYMDYHGAALRHLLKSIDGSNYDAELSELAGVPVRHDWAAMSCLAIIEDARQAGTLVDDRPVKGGAEEFLESLMVKK